MPVQSKRPFIKNKKVIKDLFVYGSLWLRFHAQR